MKHVLLILLAITSAIAVAGQPELDTTFLGTGKAVIGFGATASTRDMVVQPDNKIVMVAPCNHISFGVKTFCMARVNEDGVRDDTLGANNGTPGGVYANPPSSGVLGVALLSDGKLVLVGGGAHVVLARYLTDGTPDSTFGPNGVVTNEVTPGTADLAQKITIQPDRKMLVVGYSDGAVKELFVARYLADGTPDGSFGSSGIARVTLTSQITVGMAIAVGFDGKIVVGGIGGGANLIARLNSNGTPDTTWDGDGIITFGASAGEVGQGGILSLNVRPDGRVVALGRDNILYRFNSNGTPDLTFDGDGSRVALAGAVSDARRLVVTAGGRITVVGGRFISFIPYLFRVARILSDGTPDPGFSDDGYLEIDVDSGSDAGRTAAVDSFGRVIAGGISSNCCVQNPFEQPQFAIARFLPAPATAVGILGRVTRSDGRPARNTFLTIRNASGGVAGNTLTNPFGYYRFPAIVSGQRYTISARAKGLTFPDLDIAPYDDMVAYDIVAEH